jgi:uncharacterized protein
MSFPARLLLALIWLYQRSFSALMGRDCRFYPTCSAYTAGAIRRFGALRGTALGAARVCRCHPWAAGGYDPVPETGKVSLKKRPPPVIEPSA